MVEERAQLKQYRQKPLDIMAFRWTVDIGSGNGVNARPKKHHANPDEWFVRTRFNEEIILTEPSWITTYRDGSHGVIPDGQFLELWEDVSKIEEEVEPYDDAPNSPSPETPKKKGRRKAKSV